MEGGAVARLLREAEAELASWTHPDPYTNPYMPGGSRYMRVVPPPLALVFPHGVPPEYNIAPQTVQYIQVPMTATGKGFATALVDAYKKNVE